MSPQCQSLEVESKLCVGRRHQARVVKNFTIGQGCEHPAPQIGLQQAIGVTAGLQLEQGLNGVFTEERPCRVRLQRAVLGKVEAPGMGKHDGIQSMGERQQAAAIALGHTEIQGQ